MTQSAHNGELNIDMTPLAPDPRRRAKKKTRTIVAVIVVVAIVAAAAGFFGWRYLRDSALKGCQDQWTSLNTELTDTTTLRNDLKTASAITAEQVKDASTVSHLAEVRGDLDSIDGDLDPQDTLCPADATIKSLKTATQQLADREKPIDNAVKTVDSAVKAVNSSKAEKTYDDTKSSLETDVKTATQLASDAKGQVKDTSLTDAVNKQIDAANSAMAQQADKSFSTDKLTSAKTSLGEATKALEKAMSPDCSKEKCVAITFDDGPSAETTPGLLATLKKLNVPVTFFSLATEAKANPNILKQEIADGHAVGSHTWDHQQLSKLSADQIQQQITSSAATIQQGTGRAVTMMRPPYGDYNRTVREKAKEAGEALIMWDVDSLDWKSHNKDAILAEVNKEVTNGSIILLHDIHQTTVDSVPAVIQLLQSKGFKLVTVPQLLGNDLQPGAVYFNRNYVITK
ncbi:polysaccharide deacetylase family protein [Bifidobacterium simiarum]|uniref:polysaccharide deacetylase family protein n=1 Tax=Bifidobacterium simiarum TaxID=2045441 RepID=UPI001BDC03EB|nr:polysaccharide deacetylase family protein [Bifidobacterium simiarum]MBT1165531.1 polysaccharide deacetylase family protein [Bifidobacterium simiarum]